MIEEYLEARKEWAKARVGDDPREEELYNKLVEIENQLTIEDLKELVGMKEFGNRFKAKLNSMIEELNVKNSLGLDK